MKTHPLVSVVMSVYNCEKYIEASIESILAQTYKKFELIIVNDGSTDNTAKILNKYRKNKKIVIIDRGKIGHAQARNEACRLAKGKYIAVLDADDIALPNRFKQQVEFLENNPNIVLLGGAAILIDSAGSYVGKLKVPLRDDEIKSKLLSGNCFIHSSVMMRKEAFVCIGGYRNVFFKAHDYDLWLRISERFEVANLPQPLIKYRYHEKQVSRIFKNQQQLYVFLAQVSAKARRLRGYDVLTEKTHFSSKNDCAFHQVLCQLVSALKYLNKDKKFCAKIYRKITIICFVNGFFLRALFFLFLAFSYDPVFFYKYLKRRFSKYFFRSCVT